MTKRKGNMDILKHPIYKAIYDLCKEIEKLPPSEHATKLVVMASNLQEPADLLYASKDDALKKLHEHVQKCREEGETDLRGILSEIKSMRAASQPTLTFSDALRIAKSVLEGDSFPTFYNGFERAAFNQGIQTVINALEAAEKERKG